MTLINQVKRTGTAKESSVYQTVGASGEWGGGRRKVWLRYKIWGKRGKVERGANLMEGETHLELMHSNISAMELVC